MTFLEAIKRAGDNREMFEPGDSIWVCVKAKTRDGIILTLDSRPIKATVAEAEASVFLDEMQERVEKAEKAGGWIKSCIEGTAVKAAEITRVWISLDKRDKYLAEMG